MFSPEGVFFSTSGSSALRPIGPFVSLPLLRPVFVLGGLKIPASGYHSLPAPPSPCFLAAPPGQRAVPARGVGLAAVSPPPEGAGPGLVLSGRLDVLVHAKEVSPGRTCASAARGDRSSGHRQSARDHPLLRITRVDQRERDGRQRGMAQSTESALPQWHL